MELVLLFFQLFFYITKLNLQYFLLKSQDLYQDLQELRSKYMKKITGLPETPSLPFVDSLLPPVGLNPKFPQKEAGILEDPAVSELIPNAAHLVEIAPPSPPDEPPLPKALLYGFRDNP